MEYVDGADLERLLARRARRAARRCRCASRSAIVAPHLRRPPRRAHRGRPRRHAARPRPPRRQERQRLRRRATATVKVGDFGIAKSPAPAAPPRPRSARSRAPPAYMAPEHRIGQDVDAPRRRLRRRRDRLRAPDRRTRSTSTSRCSRTSASRAGRTCRRRRACAPTCRPSSTRSSSAPWPTSATIATPAARRSSRRSPRSSTATASPPSDKVIARWIAAELELLPDADQADAVIQSQA